MYERMPDNFTVQEAIDWLTQFKDTPDVIIGDSSYEGDGGLVVMTTPDYMRPGYKPKPPTPGSIGAITAEIYEPLLRSQLEADLVTLARFQSEQIDDMLKDIKNAKYVTFPIHTKKNTGISDE